MKKIEITDCERARVGIEYIYTSLKELVKDFGGDILIADSGERQCLKIICPQNYYDLYKCEIEDKIADVIAVGYKYAFLKKRLAVIGLSQYEIEMLYTAIISADFEEDKRYITRKLRLFESFAVDGIFNFRLKPLKIKWEQVVSYIPLFFTKNQLLDFITFVLGEKRGKKVFIEGDKVYDLNFNPLKRSSLISSSPDVVKEVLLSSSSQIEVKTPVGDKEEKYLKQFFGRRVSFLKESLQKTVDKNF